MYHDAQPREINEEVFDGVRELREGGSGDKK